MTEKACLTEVEVQLSYGIGIIQLRKMRGRGVGPRFIKISGTMGKCGGRIVYPIKDLERSGTCSRA